ncbi:MAG: hypothetical protein ACREXP_21890 [Steroidobacteraceae bacterium]
MSEGSRDRPPPQAAQPSEGLLPVGQLVERLKLERTAANPLAPPRSRPGRIITGRLEAHGPANYQFRPDGSPSYYLKILNNRGVEMLWGVDLGRAIQRSKTQPKIGSVIGARRVGSELVTLPASSAAHAADRPRSARRAQWIVESVTFFAGSMQRARRERESQLADQSALRERPELRSAFISPHVVQKFAERHIHDPRDRKLFIERVKAVMALSARSGTPIPEPRRSDRQRTPPPPAPTPDREDPTR